jgi:YegS/Rv2252/BmrU family lipid kinase
LSEAVHVILNPSSGSGAGAKVGQEVTEELRARGIDHRLFPTSGPGHAAELAQRAAEEDVGRILAVGGDGTLHEIVNGFVECGLDGPAIAVVPVGTGNDFHRMVGPKAGVKGAIETLQHGQTRAFDVGMIRWEGGRRAFVNVLGIGVDVEVLRRRERFRRLSGLTQYLAALLVSVLQFRSIGMRVTLDDGEVIEEDAIILAILVGRSMGGGFMVTPNAISDDGLLDMCLVEALSYPQIARYIPRVIRGTHEHLDVVRMRRLQSARLEPLDGRPFWFELDGELTTEPVPALDLEVMRSRITVCVPKVVA